MWRFYGNLKIIFDLYKGFVIYFLDSNNKIKSINFDIISSELSQYASAAVRRFRISRSQEFFKKIDKKNYTIWADCGKHFRNNELIGYLLLKN